MARSRPRGRWRPLFARQRGAKIQSKLQHIRGKEEWGAIARRSERAHT